MNATTLTTAQSRLYKELTENGITVEIKEKNEGILNHNDGDLYIAFIGRCIYGQKGERWILTQRVTDIRNFIKSL